MCFTKRKSSKKYITGSRLLNIQLNQTTIKSSRKSFCGSACLVVELQIYLMSNPISPLIAWFLKQRDAARIYWEILDKKTKKRIIIAFICAESVGISLLLKRIVQTRSTGGSVSVPVVVSVGLSSLLSLVVEGKISRMDFYPDGKLVGFNAVSNEFVHSNRVPGSDSAVFNLVREHCGQFQFLQARPNFGALIAQVAIPLVFFGVWYKLMKSFMKAGEDVGSPSVDRQKLIPKVAFSQVVSGGKIELQEIVSYLNDPSKFRLAGARLPRGVLLVGASGTGKTLMARAVAGESNCAFLSVSASEFVETYVGRGSARIRSLFKQAREMAPCVLFIDEIDALGKRESTFGGGTAHDEYVQTMNQLLVEMDGISGHLDGLVVVGATNRFNALDTALLRPGRFDRHVWLTLPNEQERLEILTLNCGKLKLGPDAVLTRIAQETLSFSGADLASLVNESVFFSLRRSDTCVRMCDFVAALHKTRQVVYTRTNSPASTPNRRFEDISSALE